MGSIRIRFQVLCSCHCCSGLPPCLHCCCRRCWVESEAQQRPPASRQSPATVAAHRRRHCHCAPPSVCSRVVGSHCLAFATYRAHTPAGRLRRHGCHHHLPTPPLSRARTVGTGLGFRLLGFLGVRVRDEEAGAAKGEMSRGSGSTECLSKSPPLWYYFFPFFFFILAQPLLF